MNTAFHDHFLTRLTAAAQTLADPRPRDKFRALGLGLVCGDGPKTITSALTWNRHTDRDWSADYRVLSPAQWEPAAMFQPLAQDLLAHPLLAGPYVIVAQDDTLAHKTGRKIPGTMYARDPLGPHFQANLVWAQRFVQTSLLCRPAGSAHPWRALPLAFTHAPCPKIPKTGTPEELQTAKETRKKQRLSVVASGDLADVRAALDRLPGGAARRLLAVVDGSYANRTYCDALPANTDVVARMRKDAALRAHLPVEQRVGARKYGADLPTPKELLADAARPVHSCTAFVAGAGRTVRFKEITGVCWPKVSGDRPVRLLLLKPAGYRVRKGSKLAYRDPAYLVTTDLTTPAAELIAAYLGRWEVEVNFRDEKTVLGVGQAQVWSARAVSRAPALLVACYSMLLWSAIAVYGDQRTADFGPLPRWRKQAPVRPSTRELVGLLRRQATAGEATAKRS